MMAMSDVYCWFPNTHDLVAVVTVPDRPVPKARARVVTIIDEGGKRRNRSYTPLATKAYEEAVAWAVKQELHYNEPDTEQEWALHCLFYVKDSRFYEFDVDNAVKSVADGLNKRLYADDRQVRHSCGTKNPASWRNGVPCTVIRITAGPLSLPLPVPKPKRSL